MDCIICAYPIDNKERLLCLTPCGHNEHVCSICFLRLRSLQRNFHCPTCKRDLDHVICSFTEETIVPVAPNTNLALALDKDNKDNKDNKDKDKAGGGRGRSRAKEKEKEKDDLVSSPTAAVNVAAVSAIGYAAKTRFEDFQIWGEQISEPYYIYDSRSQMFVPRFYFDEVVSKLWEFKCKICHARRKDFKELRGHYFGEHKLSMCLLCIEFKQVFPSEQSVYSKTEYERHLRRGDHDGSKGHPNCEFCKKRFYDSTPLFQHLTRDHYSCHLCTQQGIRFKYFDKYPDLEVHFRKDHWICEDPACLQRGFMAFANDIDLMSHRVQYHPQLCMGSRTIPVQFKYRGNANNNNNNNNSNTSSTPAANAEGDGEYATRTARFEGGIGGRAQNGEWQVEIETTTADPRDPNRNLLREDVPPAPAPSLSAAAAAAEDFPELPSSSGAPSSAVAMNRWVAMQSAKQQKKSKANPFPALPSAPKKTGTTLAPGVIAPPRPPPPASSSSSTAAALLEDFAAVSASGTRPSTVADSLGSWANIKVDKRVPKAKKSAAPATTSSSTAVESTEREGVKASAAEDDFSADLQRALAESLQEPFPEPPRPTPAPAPAAAPKPKAKPAVQKKAAASNDWSDALKAVGMTGAVKKKSPGITVIKAGKSEADKKLIVGTSGKQPGNWVSLGGTGAKAAKAERPAEREIPGFPSLSASSK